MPQGCMTRVQRNVPPSEILDRSIEADGISHLVWGKHHVETLNKAVDHGTWRVWQSLVLLLTYTICTQPFDMLSAASSGVLVRLQPTASSRHRPDLLSNQKQDSIRISRFFENDIAFRAVLDVGIRI